MEAADPIAEFAALIRAARDVAALTGAGISTASGIPDFRSPGGLYSNPEAENIFDLRAFRRDPSHFYRFAREFFPMVARAQPNRAHTVLAAWARDGRRVRVATQNIDDLHQRAGSKEVFAVHGTTASATCLGCRETCRTSELEPAILQGEVPTCTCGGVWKPDITFFGESLPWAALEAATAAMQEADLIVVLGTSLAVHPAGSLPMFRRPGTPLVIVNRDETGLDPEADIVVHADLCATLDAVQRRLTA